MGRYEMILQLIQILSNMKRSFLFFLLMFSLFTPHLNAQEAKDFVRHAWTTPTVFTSSETSFVIHIRAKSGDIDSIAILPGGFERLIKDGQEVSQLVLVDNGMNGDLEAGDNIFSVQGVSSDRLVIPSNPFFVNYYITKLKIYESSGPIELDTDIRLGLRCIEAPELPEVYVVNERMQYTSHVFNITHDLEITGVLRDVEEAGKRFYDVFPDDKHFFAITRDFATPDTPWGGRFWFVKNDVSGIFANNYMVDNSIDYGSSSVLEGIVEFIPGEESNLSTFSHELNHRWASYLDDSFHMSSYGHWTGIFDQPGNAQGGSGYKQIINNGDNTYTVLADDLPPRTHSPLDLYLSGYIPLEEVGFPIHVLYGGSFSVFNEQEKVYQTEMPMLTITQSDFLEKMGPRVPSSNEARKEQHMAMIVMSTNLLTPLELAYFNTIMVEHEKTEGSAYNTSSYYESTSRKGKLITELIPRTVRNTDLEELANVLFQPNPAESYIIINKQHLGSIKAISVHGNQGKYLLEVDKGLDNKIDLSNLPTGIYVLSMEFLDGSVKNQKLIIIK